MTLQTLVACPECKQTHHLLEGRFPPHTSMGDVCRMSGREPMEWPLPPVTPYQPAEGQGPGQTNPPTQATTSVGPEDTAADTKPQRKVRSDKGTKRGPKAGLPPKPQAKRSPRTYIVGTGEYKSYTSLTAACTALGEAMEEWETHPEGAEGDPPVLIVGRELRTEYRPARTVPATVRVVRGKEVPS